MAFYSNPYFTRRSATMSPYATHPQFSHGHQDHYAHAGPSLDEEERLAYAHLAAIQRRREAEQAAIQREAAARVHAQQQREAALVNAIAVERERLRHEELVRQAVIIEEHKRQQVQARIRAQAQAEAEARARHEHAFQQAIAARVRQHEVELERTRRTRAIERAHQHALIQRQQQVAQHALERRSACARQCAARKEQHRLDAKEESKVQGEDEAVGLEALNSLFGSLFGIQFDQTEEAASTETREPAPVPVPASDPTPNSAVKDETKSNASEPAFPKEINDLLSHFLGLRVDPANSESAPSSTASFSVPEGLNEFLAPFGLVFEPESGSSASKSNAVPDDAKPAPAPAPVDANPVNVESASAPKKQDATVSLSVQPTVEDPPEAPLPGPSSSAAPAPAPASIRPSHSETPLTAFLNNTTHLPPFVRDILGNVELAFKDERQRQQSVGTAHNKQAEPSVNGAQNPVEGQDKGKGVAEGEKKVVGSDSARPVPTASINQSPSEVLPTPNPTSASLSKLDDIASDLDLAVASFTFPSKLSFSNPSSSLSSSSENLVAPSLLFNRTNAPYHAQTNKLVQLLLAADSVSSLGDRSIRTRRKALVRKVEGEIEKLEKERDAVWADVRQRRERGDESEGETGAGADERSWAGSDSDSDSASESGSVNERNDNKDKTSDKGLNTSTSKNISRAASVVDEEEEIKLETEGYRIPLHQSTTVEVEQADTTPKSFADAAKTAPADSFVPETAVHKEEQQTGEAGKDDGFELV